MHEVVQLCPAQAVAMKYLHHALEIGRLVSLQSGTGEGRTTVLDKLRRERGGVLLGAGDFLEAMQSRDPLAMEEAFTRFVLEALDAHDVVLVDDYHLVHNIVMGCHYYPRQGLLDAAMSHIVHTALRKNKRLVLGTDGTAPESFRQRAYRFFIPDFTPDDYFFFCHAFLKPEQAERLDYKKVHRFAPNLNAHQLRGSCIWLRNTDELSTDRFIDYLRSQRLTSNVDLGEVRPVQLETLKGVDEVLKALEASIVLPLENDELAQELSLKPKRGVLLAGPPGTGKTTVGRALAHRLKSKFFLVDGTFIAGTSEFYGRIHQVFEAAKRNAPAIVFIDDMDAIFEDGEASSGLYRYLLTMLDGLESESAGRVCVMMTAMDVGGLPPALLRSGRIELWLEMTLPAAAARREIIGVCMANLPEALQSIDFARLTEATEGFTGADLQRVAEDGKTLYAYDVAHARELREPTLYFVAAVEGLRTNKQKYAEAEARSRQSRQNRVPPWYHGAFDMSIFTQE